MRAHRSLRATRDYERLYKEGRRLSLDGLTVYVAPRPDPASPARLGLAVRGHSLSAVVRNRIRRRLRAAFVRCGFSGVDVVVRGEQPVATLPFQVLVERLCGGIQKALGAAK